VTTNKGRPLRRSRLLLPPLVLVWAAACAGSPNQGTVNGTVTLDGRPLKEGVVRFVPADGKSPTASAAVADGKFTAAVPVGEMRVEFSAPKVVGRHKAYDTPDSPVVDDVAELLPDRYNVKTDLKLAVKKGSQDEMFALKSK
jgi:hypothetical protein